MVRQPSTMRKRTLRKIIKLRLAVFFFNTHADSCCTSTNAGRQVGRRQDAACFLRVPLFFPLFSHQRKNTEPDSCPCNEEQIASGICRIACFWHFLRILWLFRFVWFFRFFWFVRFFRLVRLFTDGDGLPIIFQIFVLCDFSLCDSPVCLFHSFVQFLKPNKALSLDVFGAESELDDFLSVLSVDLNKKQPA